MATMNRAATPVGCVLALAKQTRPPDEVIVADNASSDNTVEALRGLVGLPFPITIVRMAVNRGNAGGVEEAMALGFEKGANAVWILDDDSWPRVDALEQLLACGWDPDVVTHAMQVDPESGRLTWPLPICDGSGGWKLVWHLDELPEGKTIRSRASWTGALISRRIFEDVGPVNGELFIRGEDEEYPWRIGQAGYTFQAVPGAVLDHPGPRNIIHWRIMGRNLFLERALSDTKLYYKVRNMVWLKRQQVGRIGAILMALSYLGGTSIADGPGRLPLLWRAIRHGWRGRLGPADR